MRFGSFYEFLMLILLVNFFVNSQLQTYGRLSWLPWVYAVHALYIGLSYSYRIVSFARQLCRYFSGGTENAGQEKAGQENMTDMLSQG